MNFPLLLSAFAEHPPKPEPRRARVLVTPGVDVPAAIVEALRDHAVLVEPPDAEHFDAAHALAVASRDMVIIVGDEGARRSEELLLAAERRLARLTEIGNGLAMRALLEETAKLTAEPERELYPAPLDPTVFTVHPSDFPHPRKDRAAKRDRTGRVGRRDYNRRSFR